jgi:hypothetical protein
VLATIGILLGPLLLVTILVFGTAGMFITVQAVRMPVTIVVCHALALAVPLVLEWVGVVPASYHFEGNALVLKPWAVEVSPSATLFMIFAIIVMQLIANAVMLWAQRRIYERAQEQLHVQRWQLQQLVPSSGSAST